MARGDRRRGRADGRAQAGRARPRRHRPPRVGAEAERARAGALPSGRGGRGAGQRRALLLGHGQAAAACRDCCTRVLHRFVWDGGPVRIAGTVREGDDVAGFEVVELAGHAPGLIGLWRASDLRRARLATPSTSSTCSAASCARAHPARRLQPRHRAGAGEHPQAGRAAIRWSSAPGISARCGDRACAPSSRRRLQPVGMSRTGREIQLAARPHGEPTADDFRLVEVEVPDPARARCWSATC